MKCALVGESIGYSYSKEIHEQLGYCTYDLRSIAPEDFAAFMEADEYDGFNVTIPYKKEVMGYLDEVDELAMAIGAVNTVYKRNGKRIGTNTDYAGFLHMLSTAQKSTTVSGQQLGATKGRQPANEGMKKTMASPMVLTDRHVLVLGSGGASAMVCYAAMKAGAASITVASRNPSVQSKQDSIVRDGTPPAKTNQDTIDHDDQLPAIGYCDYDHIPMESELVINTTPLGTYPNVDASPLDLSKLPHLKGAADLVYNPARTCFLLQAAALGVPHVGGLPMLVAQAAMAAKYFTGGDTGPGKDDSPTFATGDSPTRTTDGNPVFTTGNDNFFKKDKGAEILQLTQKIAAAKTNLVLIGMPGCGKSTLGKELAKATGRPFVDSDLAIRTRTGKHPRDILTEQGEDAFRAIESAVYKDLGLGHGQIIACGGGVVERPENLAYLQRNGRLVYIQKRIEKLATRGRPLSQNPDSLKTLYQKRTPLYKAWADETVNNNRHFRMVLKDLLRLLHDPRL